MSVYRILCSACVTGRWGEQCQHSCSVTCVNTACHRDTGVCTACVTGRWGEQCQHSCSVTCVNTACHRNTGICTGCVDGRHGASCNTACSPAGCQTCHQHSGQCTACRPLYNLDLTSQCTECADGFYRKTANAAHCTECSGRCHNNTPCNKTTGDCDRCPPGWEGPRCFKGVSEGEAEKLTGPVVGAITGVGLLLVVSLLVFLCWKQRSQ
ncbi:scavenger receptor class F member 1-like [Littorina saxatilis]|uniref:scavenger receptor class F member 1-like n=1 Tax=Littorina saxatilis TaxID=31220 RepID=UPI0038B4DCAC